MPWHTKNASLLCSKASQCVYRVIPEIFISASSANVLPAGKLLSACFPAGLITLAAALHAGSATGNSGTTGSGNAWPVGIPEG